MISIRLLMSIVFIFMLAFPAVGRSGEIKVDFKGEIPGTEARSFRAVGGDWHIEKDGDAIVYVVGGRERGAEFPLSVFKGVQTFKAGAIEVSFKSISGKEDQAAGIAFNIKPNGDYFVIRANALEDNLILFKMEKGVRSSLKSVAHVPTASGKWHTLKVVINGMKIEGYLDGGKYLDYVLKEDIEGGIGLWSKADSYVVFDKFTATPAQ
jgi:hypothetical protein